MRIMYSYAYRPGCLSSSLATGRGHWTIQLDSPSCAKGHEFNSSMSGYKLHLCSELDNEQGEEGAQTRKISKEPQKKETAHTQPRERNGTEKGRKRTRGPPTGMNTSPPPGNGNEARLREWKRGPPPGMKTRPALSGAQRVFSK